MTVRIVLLRFADSNCAEFVVNQTEGEAIAGVAGKALATGNHSLPLLGATVFEVPMERMRAIVGAEEPTPPPPRPALPIVGLIQAVKKYVAAVAASREKESLDEAGKDLSAFLSYYEIALDFRVATPRAPLPNSTAAIKSDQSSPAGERLSGYPAGDAPQRAQGRPKHSDDRDGAEAEANPETSA